MQLRSLIRQPPTFVWLGLMLVTGVSWWLGTDHGANHKLATIVVMVVAFTKVRFVGMYFMELRHAPLPLKLIFQGWCVVVCSVIIVMYLSGA